MRLFILCFLFFLSLRAEDETPLLPGLGSSEEIYYKKFVEGSNQIAFELYHNQSKQGGNFYFSPYSLVTGLGRVAVGTSGKTAKSLETFFHFSFPLFLFSSDLKGGNPANESTFFFTNSLWIDNSLSLLPSFIQTQIRNFRQPPQRIDFTSTKNAPVEVINQWVREQTHGRITHFLSGTEVTPKTKLLLLTGFYAQMRWNVPFDSQKTKRLPFQVSPSRSIYAEMMQTVTSCLTSSEESADFMALPLKNADQGSELFFVCILPKKNTVLTEPEKHFSYELWLKGKEHFESKKMKITLPSFYIENHRLFDSSLKMLEPSLFSPETDFSNMTETKNISLSHVVHKCSIGIGEEGVSLLAPHRRFNREVPDQEISEAFEVSRPFVFLLWDKKSDLILSMGRIIYP